MSGPNDDSDDSDEWATEDLPDLPVIVGGGGASSSATPPAEQEDDDEGWERKLPPPASAKKEEEDQEEEGFPMIIVDMTQLSNDAIHSKFDANAVNDPQAVKKLRLEIEKDYFSNNYAKNNVNLVADGTVIPCGSSVWRPALERLRRERQGHYFCPIFPPKEPSKST